MLHRREGRRVASRLVRMALLLLLAGVPLGVLGALVGSFMAAGPASATPPLMGCSLSGTTLYVGIDPDAPVTLSLSSSSPPAIEINTGSGAMGCGGANLANTQSIVVGASAPSVDNLFDLTVPDPDEFVSSGGACSGPNPLIDFRTDFPDSTGQFLQVPGASLSVNIQSDLNGTDPDPDVTIGSSGADLAGQEGSCAGEVPQFSGVGVGSWTVTTSATDGPNLSAAGAATTIDSVGTDTGTPTTASVTFTSTGSASQFQAGAGEGSFYASQPGSTIDFSAVAAGTTSPLEVNASQVADTVDGNTVRNGQAALGASVLYTFSNGPGLTSTSNFSSLVAASSGYTTFLAGSTGGYTFCATATCTTGAAPVSTDAVDFTNASNGVLVNLSSVTQPLTTTVTIDGVSVTAAPDQVAVVTGAPPAEVTDTLDGIIQVTGSEGGDNTFFGGSGTATETFTAAGTDNVFYAGTGSDTFDATGTGNTANFSLAGAGLAVNVSGVEVGAIPDNSATTSSGALYTFTPGAFTIFKGASGGGTVFYAGNAADAFDGSGSGNTLSFADAPSSGPLTISDCASSSGGSDPCTGVFEAVLGSVDESFANITTFDGLAGGNTTFVTDGTSPAAFVGTGSGNSADFTDAPASTVNLALTVDLLNPTSTPNVTFAGSPEDTVVDVSTVTGSKNGNDIFVAGTTSETFKDPRTTGGNDTIDFNYIPTSSTTPLTINVTGAPVSGIPNSSAVAGTLTFSFSGGGTAGFSTFIGAGTGYTTFLAGNTGGYTFCATDTSGSSGTCDTTAAPVSTDAVDLASDAAGVIANLSPVTEDSVGSGEVLLSPAPGHSCPTDQDMCDTLDGVATVVGSAVGSNTFFGGVAGNTFSSQSSSGETLSYAGLPGDALTLNLQNDTVSMTGTSGPVDSFQFAPGAPLDLVGSSGQDTFMLGSTAATLDSGGGLDQLDLDQLSGPTSVDLNAGDASGNVTFTFADDSGTCPTDDLCLESIIGSPGGTTLTATSTLVTTMEPLTFSGMGANNTLNLAPLGAGADICMPGAIDLPAACSGGSVSVSGSEIISFTDVQSVIGTGLADALYPGSTSVSFQDGAAATLYLGSAFTAGVTVSYTGAAGSATAPLGGGITDTFTGITTVIGPSGPDSFTVVDGSGDSYMFTGGSCTSPSDNCADSFAVIDGSGGTYVFAGGNCANSSDNCADTYNLSGAGGGTYTLLGGLTSGMAPTSFLTLPAGTTVAPAGTGYSAIGVGLQVGFSNIATLIFPGGTTVEPDGSLDLEGSGTGNELNLSQFVTTATVSVGSDGGSAAVGADSVTFTGIQIVVGTPFDDTFDVNAVPSGSLTLEGGGGNDTLSFAGAPVAATANLSSAAVEGIPAGVADLGGTTIDISGFSNYVASPFGDTVVAGLGAGSLVGGAGSDRFVLTGGSDVVSGGGGDNILDLSQIPGATQVNLNLGGPQSYGPGTLEIVAGSIQTVIGSAAGSVLDAGYGTVTLVGGPGNDTLIGDSGDQVLTGGDGTNVIEGGAGEDTMTGGTGTNTFEPGSSGTDTIVGQSGATNILSYAGAPAGALVNLSSTLFTVPPPLSVVAAAPIVLPYSGTVLPAETASGGWGAEVNLSQASITEVTGTAFSDVIVTNAKGDIVNGNGGNDLIVTTAGNNTLTVGSGTASYFLIDGPGNDDINGGGQSTLDLALAPQGAFVDLQSGIGTGAFGGTLTLSGVLNVIGTNQSDVLIAGAPGGQLIGLNGNDFLQSGPGGGNTLIGGGGGDDTFCAVSDCASPGTSAAGGDTLLGGTGNDIFFADSGAGDVINGGGGFNEAAVDPADTVTNIQEILP